MVERIWFLGAEIGSYLLWVLCVIHVFWEPKKRAEWPSWLSFLVSTVFFGCLLEFISIVLFHGYAYNNGPFLVVLGGVPLLIGVDWSLILYCSMTISTMLDDNILFAALFDIYLVLNVDVGVDAIAIRLGLWSWSNPIDDPYSYLGVPLSNFVGWAMVAFGYSFSFRLFHWLAVRKLPKGKAPHLVIQILYPLLAVIPAVGLLFGSLYGFGFLISTTAYAAQAWHVQLGLFLGPTIAILLVLIVRSIKRPWNLKNALRPPALIIGGVIAIFHGFFFVALLVFGLELRSRGSVILAMSIVMAALGVALHTLPYTVDIYRRLKKCKWFTVQVEFEEKGKGYLYKPLVAGAQ